MHLVSYKLHVPVSVGTMDKYFHLMFAKVIPVINSNGSMTGEDMHSFNLERLKNALMKLTTEHPVKWTLRVYNRGNEYDVIAIGGKVKYKRVKFNQNDISNSAT